jgi:large subunit ribosomal protein L17
MFDNMVTSLFLHERILTTLDRAKELRRVAEKLITLGKRGDLHARRLAARRLRTTGQKVEKVKVQKEEALRRLFEDIAPRYADRPGGYTRIIKTGNRLGDNAKMAFIELLPEEKKARKGKKKPAKKARKIKGVEKVAKATKEATGPKKAKAAPKKPATPKKAGAAKGAQKATKKTAKKKKSDD